jgi:DNA-binding LacI/PurR family transcriptional regulator
MKKRSQNPGRGDPVEIQPRPSERVMRYLMAEFDRPEIREGTRLPTVRELARRLDISVCTVHGVFKELSRQGRIRTEVGKGTFLVTPPRQQEAGGYAVAISTPIPSGSATTRAQDWHYSIYWGVLQASLQAEKTVTILPLDLEDRKSDGGWRTAIGRKSAIHGVIVFPSGDRVVREELRRACELAGTPIVSLNPPTEIATTDFVSPDYFRASYHLGQAWRKSGRRRILLVTHVPMEESVSGRLRLAGLMAGLAGDSAQDVRSEVLAVSSLAEGGLHAAILRRFSRARRDFDAVCCVGDYMAIDVIGALREAGCRVPEDVSVVGGSGVDLSATLYPLLTRTAQPLQQMGGALLDMLLERIRNGGRSLPGRFFDSPFIGGASTRPEENVILGIKSRTS